tara:strand:+ start:1800 stop:2174 length:375 start_codon:yes stop_codon:yes gene_type:complete
MSSYFSRALEALKPNSEWAVTGDQYSRLTWLDESQTKPTEDEINAKIAELKAAEPFRLLREERNRRLAECDWVVTKATELGKTVSEDWVAYRQTLRHLPENASPKLNSIGQLDLTSVDWPTKPS